MKVLFVGDTHENPFWWTQVVVPVAQRIDADVIVQVGDFGYWPGFEGAIFLDEVRASPIPVHFIDGNHEHFGALHDDVTDARAADSLSDTDPVPLGGALTYLPRGARITFGSVRVVACGGAVSIDQGAQTPGVGWFPEERITTADLHRVADGGVADVLVCHDAPSGWAIPGVAAPESFHESWKMHLPAAYEHRMILRDAYEAVQPRVVIHGHYHTRYRHLAEESWGTVIVDGLAGDGDPGAFVAMNCTDTPELLDVSVSLR